MQLEMTAIRSPSCAVVPIGIAVRVAKAKRLGHHLTAAESKRRPCLEFSSGKGAGTQTAEGKPIARTASCGPEPFPLAQSLPRNTFKWYNNLWHYIMMCFETKKQTTHKGVFGNLVHQVQRFGSRVLAVLVREPLQTALQDQPCTRQPSNLSTSRCEQNLPAWKISLCYKKF